MDSVAPAKISNTNTLLIVRLDAIGDYILFRNFLEEIRRSQKYKHYKITLCGNELWKSIALAYDKQFVDDFIWVNYSSFINDGKYRKTILKQISSLGVETSICPNAARNFLAGDAIVRASHAKVRIGSKPTTSIDNMLFGMIGNLFYTKLIDNTSAPFEFDKNILFFQTLLNQYIDFKTPVFKQIQKENGNYILIFPGAGEPKRQWSPAQFVSLINDLSIVYPFKILIGGSASDKKLADKIIAGIKNKRTVENITGKTSLDELVKLIASARLVVAHDSGTLHIAVATGTCVVGLMTGKHYKRFGPYPNQPNNVLMLFPKPEIYYQDLFRKYGPLYFESVVSDINEITAERVFESCKGLLQ